MSMHLSQTAQTNVSLSLWSAPSQYPPAHLAVIAQGHYRYPRVIASVVLEINNLKSLRYPGKPQFLDSLNPWNTRCVEVRLVHVVAPSYMASYL
jgi:hypothetical protein